MPVKNIVTGQHISVEMQARARALRRRMTPAEGKLWQRLRTGRLEGYHFRRQQIIDHYIADFYCHTAKLVVEVDGAVHLDQEVYDRERDHYLEGMGLRVIRFTNSEIERNLEACLSAILEACRLVEGEDVSKDG